MKNNQITLLLLILCFSTNLFSQNKKIDSLIYVNNLQLKNPKIKSLDSIRQNYNKPINNLYKEGYTISTNEYEAPNFYHIQKDGKKISMNDYLYKELKKVSTRFKAYFKIEVDWNGQINYINLIAYQGDIKNIDFINLWKGIKAIPATEFNIPIKTVVTIPIKKN